MPRSIRHAGGSGSGRRCAASAACCSVMISARSARPSSPRRYVTTVRRRSRSGGSSDTAQPPYCAFRASLHAAGRDVHRAGQMGLRLPADVDFGSAVATPRGRARVHPGRTRDPGAHRRRQPGGSGHRASRAASDEEVSGTGRGMGAGLPIGSAANRPKRETWSSERTGRTGTETPDVAIQPQSPNRYEDRGPTAKTRPDPPRGRCGGPTMCTGPPGW